MGNAYIQTISAETFIPVEFKRLRAGKCHRRHLTLKNGLQIITGSDEILAASEYLRDIYKMRNGIRTNAIRPDNRIFVRFRCANR